MRTRRKLTLAAIASVLATSSLLAHHDWPVDRSQRVTIKGTVTAFTWANPHVTIALDVQADGGTEKWILGASSPKVMGDAGWDKNTVKPGDVVTGFGYRFRNGSHVTQVQRVALANGKELFAYARLFDF
jgi:hypothetical protein